MKRAQWIILAVVFAAAPPLLASETFSQCLENCRPGRNACTDCCNEQVEKALKPCRLACDVAHKKCLDDPAMCKAVETRWQQADAWYKNNCVDRQGPPQNCADLWQYAQERRRELIDCVKGGERQCANALFACTGNCRAAGASIPGNCPGEVPPQKCEYTCQVWNSASKSCVGLRSNECK